jgi:hypothetical protein
MNSSVAKKKKKTLFLFYLCPPSTRALHTLTFEENSRFILFVETGRKLFLSSLTFIFDPVADNWVFSK